MFRRVKRLIHRFGRPAVPPLLQRANHMLNQGEYADAESAFYELAKKAEGKFPQHAPFLYLQAGRAAVLAKQIKKGMAHFRSTLTLLGGQGRLVRLEKIAHNIIQELRHQGLTLEADEIAKVLSNNLPSPLQKAERPSSSKQKAILPTHCPSCGAIVRPNEVEWLDEITAECDYCGSPLRKA